MRERLEINSENRLQHENDVSYGVRVAIRARYADGEAPRFFVVRCSSSRITLEASVPKNLSRTARIWFRCAQTIIELRT